MMSGKALPTFTPRRENTDTDGFAPHGAGPRLIWLHLASRQVPAAVVILVGLAAVLAVGLRLNWIIGNGPLAQ